MAIIRTTPISDRFAQDGRISLRARGLLALIVTTRPSSPITVESLTASNPEGRDAIRRGIAELEAAGYLQRIRKRADGGRLAGVDYWLTDPHDQANRAGERGDA